MEKRKTAETFLIFAGVFVLIFLLKKRIIFLYISLGSVLIYFLIPPLAEKISILWLKFGRILGEINTKIVLFLVFYLILTPLAIIRKVFTVDFLELKKNKNTFWKERKESFEKEEMERMW